MSERAPTHFDPTTLGEALHTAAQPTTDLAFGPGQRYDLPAGQASLEVFPERPLTRLTTAAARVELFDTPPPRTVNNQVIISQDSGQEDATLTISPDGTVVFSYVHRPAPPATSDGTSHVPVASDCDVAPAEPATAPEPAQEPAPTAADTAPVVGTPPAATTQRRPSPGSSPPDAPPPATADTASTTSDVAPASGHRPVDRQPAEQPRLQLTGRLGRDPNFRTSPRGTFIGRFPLAVHRDDGTTTWHTILAFGERAKQLQHRAEAGELAKGQEVNLIGYPHTRDQPTRDGGSKTVTEIYAVAVTRR